MANRTDRGANWVHGTNPQYLVEKIIRSRIYGCLYWKSECFGLDSETIVDRIVELEYIGGCFGGNEQPTPFLCLILKLLQLQPEKDIVLRFIQQQDFKYLRAIGAFYLRLVGSALDVYSYLEPFYNDYSKLRRRLPDGSFVITHMDEFIDELFHEDRVCSIILPRLLKRGALEESGQLEIRRSVLEDELEEEELNGLAESDSQPADEPSSPGKKSKSCRRSRSRSRSGSQDRSSRKRSRRSRSRSRSRSRDKHRGDRDRSRSRERDRHRERSRRSRSRDRSRDRSRERKRHEPRKRSGSRDRTASQPKKTDDKDKEKEKKKAPAPVTSSSGKVYTEEELREIEETNALRASLGLKPLRL